MRTSRRARGAALALAVTTALTALGAGCASSAEKPEASPTASSTGPSQISFAVYGAPAEVAVYEQLATEFHAANPDITVTVQKYETREAAMRAVEEGRRAGTGPDVFLMDQRDLSSLIEEKAVRRVDDLLGERRVDFGDGYGRTGLEAFSADSALQCMPADVSPLVVFYNPTLIDLPTVAEPGRNQVNQKSGWSMDEFAVAARQPNRPGARGVYIAPTLEQVAPFIWSGGGEVVDDTDNPKSLKLADGSSASALEQLLELVRDPSITYNQQVLQRRSALDRFKAGKLGMILGHRDLVPELRAQKDLFFDVMPMPRLSSRATTAEFQGLCLSSRSKHTDAAADFLTYLVSEDSARKLAATGYAMPTNLSVLNSGTFLQGDQQPLNAEVFVRAVRDARTLPDTETWPSVSAVASLALTDLFYQPVIDPLQDKLQAIDDSSMQIFDPNLTPSESPSPTESPTESPTGSGTETPSPSPSESPTSSP